MEVIWGHEREMLGEVDLDFREVVGRGLEVRDQVKGAGDGAKSTVSSASSRPSGASTMNTLSGTTVNGSPNSGELRPEDSATSQVSGNSYRSTLVNENGRGRAR